MKRSQNSGNLVCLEQQLEQQRCKTPLYTHHKKSSDFEDDSPDSDSYDLDVSDISFMMVDLDSMDECRDFGKAVTPRQAARNKFDNSCDTKNSRRS
jgi:hypothetical protein